MEAYSKQESSTFERGFTRKGALERAAEGLWRNISLARQGNIEAQQRVVLMADLPALPENLSRVARSSLVSINRARVAA